MAPTDWTALAVAIGLVIYLVKTRRIMMVFAAAPRVEGDESGERQAAVPRLYEYVEIPQDVAAQIREELETAHLNERASHRHLIACYADLALVTEERDTLRKENDGLRNQLEMTERQLEDGRMTLQAKEGEAA